jgi:molybdopterin molybdotransferase
MPAIELAEALRRLQSHLRNSRPRDAEPIDLSRAVNRVLAEDRLAPHDHPPTDQSLRDGVAYAAAQVEQTGASQVAAPDQTDSSSASDADLARLRSIVGTIYPGDLTPAPLLPGQAVRVMTGAPLPAGTVAVAMIEDVQFLSPPQDQTSTAAASTGAAPIAAASAPGRPWQTAESATHVLVPPSTATQPRYVLAQGQVYRRAEVLVTAGTRLRPVHVGLLASAGYAQLPCFRPPRVAVLTTGDELCPPGAALPPGQIYNSNGPLLQAALQQAGIPHCHVQHLGDSQAEIRAFLAEQLGQVDLLLTTGAVSAGQKDQLPHHFADLGVEPLFHGVHIKPGKPVYCGHWSRQPATNANSTTPAATYVLGLPGNPISVWTTFQLFARPILAALLGTSAPPRWLHARLAHSGHFNDARLTFWPGRLETTDAPWQITALKDTALKATAEKDTAVATAAVPDSAALLPTVTPLPWQGSPDLKTPTLANVLIYFPPQPSGPTTTAATPVSVLWLEE